jgi:hypothetical protein
MPQPTRILGRLAPTTFDNDCKFRFAIFSPKYQPARNLFSGTLLLAHGG